MTRTNIPGTRLTSASTEVACDFMLRPAAALLLLHFIALPPLLLLLAQGPTSVEAEKLVEEGFLLATSLLVTVEGMGKNA